MPRIISTGSTKASIEAIKKYFCSEYAVELVAQQTGINYDELIGGEYKLLFGANRLLQSTTGSCTP